MKTAEGERFVVGVDWTDKGAEGDCESKSPGQLLDYGGLIQVIELMERIQQRESDPVGEEETACQTEEEDYDGKSQPQVKESSEEP